MRARAPSSGLQASAAGRGREVAGSADLRELVAYISTKNRCCQRAESAQITGWDGVLPGWLGSAVKRKIDYGGRGLVTERCARFSANGHIV